MAETTDRYAAGTLQAFAVQALRGAGARHDDARLVADGLICADLRANSCPKTSCPTLSRAVQVSSSNCRTDAPEVAKANNRTSNSVKSRIILEMDKSGLPMIKVQFSA